MLNSKKYMDYLPLYLQQVKELNEIGNVADDFLKLLLDNENIILQEAFVETAQTYGLDKMENMLGIVNWDSDAEIRRKKILTRLRGDTPYTFERVYAKLKAVCGENNVVMKYGNKPYTLVVKIGIKGKDYINIVREYLQQVIPANISLDCSIAYNTHSSVSTYTHEYLHGFKNSSIKEEVIE